MLLRIITMRNSIMYASLLAMSGLCCSQSLEPSSNAHSQRVLSVKHFAPLKLCDKGKYQMPIPSCYQVYLELSHTLEMHNHAIGFEIEPHLINIMKIPSSPWIVYNAERIDDSRLTAIRSDPAVRLVECNKLMWLDDNET
jgi:hypothetical protein